jgi:hypothetical protein
MIVGWVFRGFSSSAADLEESFEFGFEVAFFAYRDGSATFVPLESFKY